MQIDDLASFPVMVTRATVVPPGIVGSDENILFEHSTAEWCQAGLHMIAIELRQRFGTDDMPEFALHKHRKL